MSRGNGQILLPPVPAPQPVMTPVNDLQVIALVAANLYGVGDAADPRAAVAVALEIVAETAAQMADLGALVRAKQQERERREG